MSNVNVVKPRVDVISAEQPLDADNQEQAALFKAFMVTVQHFFGGFKRLFQGVTDPRHPAYITFPLPSVLTTGVFMFLLRLGARRQVNLMLRQNGPSSAKFEALFCVETCPHGDTLNETYSRLNVAQIQAVVTGSVETLIRRKVLPRASGPVAPEPLPAEPPPEPTLPQATLERDLRELPAPPLPSRARIDHLVDFLTERRLRIDPKPHRLHGLDRVVLGFDSDPPPLDQLIEDGVQRALLDLSRVQELQ